MRKIFSLLALVISPLLALAEEYETAKWDQAFRESGKIYVVVAVIGLILISMLVYLVLQDKRITKLEKEINR